MWEPFEEQFKPIEIRFLNNADIVFRLVMTHSANMEHQNHAYKKETQQGENYSYKLGIFILTWDVGESSDSEERRKILRWLSLDDFEQTHERHLKKRFEKTGEWLLDDSRFINWRDGGQSSLLWCHGARKYLIACCSMEDYC